MGEDQQQLSSMRDLQHPLVTRDTVPNAYLKALSSDLRSIERGKIPKDEMLVLYQHPAQVVCDLRKRPSKVREVSYSVTMTTTVNAREELTPHDYERPAEGTHRAPNVSQTHHFCQL